MKMLTIRPLVLAVSLGAMSTLSFAQSDVNLDDITMDVVEKKPRHAKELKMQYRDIVLDYMIENGDITLEEIDARKAEMKARHDAIREARENGDDETLATLKEEMKAQRDDFKAVRKAYLDENEALREQLQAARQESKRGRKGGQYREIVNAYMLEKGDITQEELDARKADMKEKYEAMKAAKDSGDTDAVAVLKEEMKVARDEHKANAKAYIAENDELKDQLREAREEQKEKRKERQQEGRDNQGEWDGDRKGPRPPRGDKG